jgi:hypothetical protein
MNQDFNKIFKTPKYTGVTLSLLSMFVLAAMFVVWQKFPKQDPQESEQNISILCDFKLKIPVEKILASFKKEYPCSFLINFMDAEELTSALENKSGSYADLLIANKTILQKFTYSDYGEGIPFAFEKLSNSPPEQQSGEPFLCSIKNDTPHSHLAFALGRYFSAPSRGQFFLAEAGFTGVNGDIWKLRPRVSVLVPKTYEDRTIHIAKKFSELEGVNLDVMGKDELEANATIHLISKSNAKEYFPDLLIGYKELSTDNKSYFPVTENSRQGLVSFSTKYKRTAIRFFNFYNRES